MTEELYISQIQRRLLPKATSEKYEMEVNLPAQTHVAQHQA